jgi:hypothetical protein
MKKNKMCYYATTIILLTTLELASCSKKSSVDNNPVLPADTVIKAPVDPDIAPTIGFFLDNWQPKTYVQPSYTEVPVPNNPSTTVTIDAANVITKIPVTIFGHNANNWMTSMYDQPLFISQTTNLNPHVLRFPAGSGSDAFFWNCSTKPPADAPTYLINADGTNSSANPYTYGQTINNWQATLDDYYKVLQQTNSIGLLTMNYGYARYGTGPNPVATAAHLAADWVRYDNGRTKYWEIGNENYGNWESGYRINTAANQDGQPEYLTGQLYGQHFKVFYDSMKNAAQSLGLTIYIGAVEYESPSLSWEVPTTQNWNTGNDTCSQ